MKREPNDGVTCLTAAAILAMPDAPVVNDSLSRNLCFDLRRLDECLDAESAKRVVSTGPALCDRRVYLLGTVPDLLAFAQPRAIGRSRLPPNRLVVRLSVDDCGIQLSPQLATGRDSSSQTEDERLEACRDLFACRDLDFDQLVGLHLGGEPQSNFGSVAGVLH